MTKQIIGYLLVTPLALVAMYSIIHEIVCAIKGDKVSQVMMGILIMCTMFFFGMVILGGII